MKRKKILLIAITIVAIALSVAGTFAYYMDQGKTHNVITSGNLKIQIIEKTFGENGEIIDFPEEWKEKVTPGTVIPKMVTVKNVGEQTAWVRISTESLVLLENGEQLSGDYITPIYSGSDKWEYKDGYWYYLEPLKPGETTEQVIKEIMFNPGMGNNLVCSKLDLRVNAEAVQVVNNSDSVFEAIGW